MTYVGDSPTHGKLNRYQKDMARHALALSCGFHSENIGGNCHARAVAKAMHHVLCVCHWNCTEFFLLHVKYIIYTHFILHIETHVIFPCFVSAQNHLRTLYVASYAYPYAF